LYFSLVFFKLKFSFEGLRNSGIPYARTNTEVSIILQYRTIKHFVELREIKSIPYKIPYSAEFQKGTGTLENIPPIAREIKVTSAPFYTSSYFISFDDL
jgi:hypothetical protein